MNKTQVVDCTNSQFELKTTKVELVRVISDGKHTPTKYTVEVKQIHCYGDILLAETMDWKEAYTIRDEYQLREPQKRFGVRPA